MVQNAVIIEATDRVGSYSAEEDDQFLFDCFFQHPAFGIVRELTKSECILYGNTGSGKTAIIRYLNQVSENSLQVDLNEIALNYIANSNIVKILEDLGVSQNLLFKAFWQYIIVLSYIRSGFLKFTIFVPILISLTTLILGMNNGMSNVMFILSTVLFLFACINYKNRSCATDENPKHKGAVFKSGLITLIPYFAIIPLTFVVLKVYPKPEFINVFGETYGVLANRMKIVPNIKSSVVVPDNIIKHNNGLFVWVILTTLYLTHVSEMVLVLSEC